MMGDESFSSGTKRKEVTHSDYPETKAYRPQQSDFCNDLLVLKLPWFITTKHIKDHFSQFGEVAFAQVKVDQRTGYSKGFGFIKYRKQENERKCLQHQQHIIMDCVCQVRISKINAENRKIFVGRLNPSITREHVKIHFEQYGVIEDVYIPEINTYGFVTFADSSSLSGELLEEFHKINGRKVYVTPAIPRAHINHPSNLKKEREKSEGSWEDGEDVVDDDGDDKNERKQDDGEDDEAPGGQQGDGHDNTVSKGTDQVYTKKRGFVWDYNASDAYNDVIFKEFQNMQQQQQQPPQYQPGWYYGPPGSPGPPAPAWGGWGPPMGYRPRGSHGHNGGGGYGHSPDGNWNTWNGYY